MTSISRLYMGMEKRNGEVITEKGNKWSNLEYYKLTGLREYAPYMMGGGCGPHGSYTLSDAILQLYTIGICTRV